MIYQSTRNNNELVNSAEAVVKGIADDGGLYMLSDFSKLNFDYKSVLNLTAMETAEKILGALLDDFSAGQMKNMVEKAYKGRFETDELTPTVKVGNDFVLELFRGPTSAFKDVALSMLPRLMTEGRKMLSKENDTVILTATSGDTGKAALEGFHDVEGIKIIVFYPDGGVSAVQKAQMVTQEGSNVCVCAVKGNFDDAQTGVKNAFAAFKKSGITSVQLSSANSINIGRLVPQVVYYFTAYSSLVKMGEINVGDKINFVVPTGNFGDILAGYFAKCMGLPVNKLICASNANNVLTDFITTGLYDRRREFFKTISPSMDILVSSNLERLLYLLSDGDAEKVATYMKDLNEKGYYKVSDDILEKLQETFVAAYCNDEETLKTIKKVYDDNGYLCDTHTAVAFAANYLKPQEGKTVILSTASPYKFPVAVLSALGEDNIDNEFRVMDRIRALTGVPIPKNLAGLESKPVLHSCVIEKDEITDFVMKKVAEEKW
ncbi:MAG: threonine synthase [Ruminococcaceae bacterium]|nr:threonine synthase [Oscillospiraceae bacterium]